MSYKFNNNVGEWEVSIFVQKEVDGSGGPVYTVGSLPRIHGDGMSRIKHHVKGLEFRYVVDNVEWWMRLKTDQGLFVVEWRKCFRGR